MRQEELQDLLNSMSLQEKIVQIGRASCRERV